MLKQRRSNANASTPWCAANVTPGPAESPERDGEPGDGAEEASHLVVTHPCATAGCAGHDGEAADANRVRVALRATMATHYIEYLASHVVIKY